MASPQACWLRKTTVRRDVIRHSAHSQGSGNGEEESLMFFAAPGRSHASKGDSRRHAYLFSPVPRELATQRGTLLVPDLGARRRPRREPGTKAGVTHREQRSTPRLPEAHTVLDAEGGGVRLRPPLPLRNRNVSFPVTEGPSGRGIPQAEHVCVESLSRGEAGVWVLPPRGSLVCGFWPHLTEPLFPPL